MGAIQLWSPGLKASLNFQNLPFLINKMAVTAPHRLLNAWNRNWHGEGRGGRVEGKGGAGGWRRLLGQAIKHFPSPRL